MTRKTATNATSIKKTMTRKAKPQKSMKTTTKKRDANTMKAFFTEAYGSADVLVLKKTTKPQLPSLPSNSKKNAIVVKVEATAITMVDAMLRSGKPLHIRLFLGITKPKHPILGTGFSGIVEQVSSDASRFKVGDAVFGETGIGFSANAEYVCLTEDAVVQKKPKTLDHAMAACLCDGMLTSYSFLTDIVKIKKGDHVLINGAAGSLGSAAVQIAKLFGAKVTAVCSRNNADFVHSLGADGVIDYHADDFTANTNTYSIVYDAVGKSSFSKCKDCLSTNGVYLCPVLSLPLLFHTLITAKIAKKKAIFSATGLRPQSRLVELLKEIIKHLQKKKLKVVISKRYRFGKLPDGHRHIDSGHKRANIVAVL